MGDARFLPSGTSSNMLVPTAVQLPYSAQWDLTAKDGRIYRIQVAWPMHWRSREGHSKVPVFYAVDGNAMFLSAAEAAWRRATSPHFGDGGVVIAIGYQLDDRVYSPRRNYDLTPPSPTSPGGYGGAEHLLDFIEEKLKPFVSSTVLPNTTIGREALFGHSFGGLFTLHALFTRPHMFDCYIAGSPSIYWNDFAILKHEDRFRNGNGHKSLMNPALMMLYGSFEQHPAQWADEDDEKYRKRRQGAESRAMADSAIAMQGRLKDCSRLSCVAIKEYPEEDHGTVIACALSRSLTTFFEEWPIRA